MSELEARRALAAITEARLEFGARGRAMATRDIQTFALDHARARAAVMSALDLEAVGGALRAAGLETVACVSAAGSRDVYIKRPDLGRMLPDAAAEALSAGPYDVSLVLGDGLSATASNQSGAAFFARLAAAVAEAGLSTSRVVLAEQARVALGDKIALAQRAEIVVMALGERPGLSAADSLGVYVTFDPSAATADSARNCISNIRPGGLGVEDAVAQVMQMIADMRRHRLSGVALGQRLNSAGVIEG
ncbi:MAG: ethanolamine ammonia-lyase subunit EutC [Pseudomonadota bacterium]